MEIQKLKEQLETERGYLQEVIKLEYNHKYIIGKSQAKSNVFYKIEQIAATNTNVLVLGETGTVKQLVARAIHGLSLRKDRALVKTNCAALPSNLIDSERFGHEKGAFTGALSRRLGRFEVAILGLKRCILRARMGSLISKGPADANLLPFPEPVQTRLRQDAPSLRPALKNSHMLPCPRGRPIEHVVSPVRRKCSQSVVFWANKASVPACSRHAT